MPVFEASDGWRSDPEFGSQLGAREAMQDAIGPERMSLFHNDTYGIVNHFGLSIPNVSDRESRSPYYGRMEKEPWKNWGERFRILAKENGETLFTVAGKMGLAESTLRSWTNGTREVNLTDFIAMCIAARVHPSMVLFEGPPMDAETMRQIGALAKTAFKSDAGIEPEPQTIPKKRRSG